MKLLLAALAAILPLSAVAQPSVTSYQALCHAETPSQFITDVCTVVETREPSGALRTRNIFSNRFGLTVKSRFDPIRGFVTWDSINKVEYQWSYRVGNVDGTVASYVIPRFLVEGLSWD